MKDKYTHSQKTDEKKWYKDYRIAIPAFITILAVVLGNFLGVYFDMINTQRDFVFCVDPPKTPKALSDLETSRSCDGGTILTTTVLIDDLSFFHWLFHRYPHRIFLTSENAPEGVNVRFVNDLVNLSQVDGQAETNIIIEVAPDVKPGPYMITLKACGGDGTERSCYYMLEIPDNSEYRTKYIFQSPEFV